MFNAFVSNVYAMRLATNTAETHLRCAQLLHCDEDSHLFFVIIVLYVP